MKIKETIKFQNYIWVKVNYKVSEANEANKWCIEHQCGKRVNKDTFSFKNEDEVTMFHLKWVTE